MTDKIETKQCVVCNEAIHFDAKKCFHCESFQNWKRHITGSQLVLSLLVALVSVLSVGVPVIVDALNDEDSQINIQITYARQSRAVKLNKWEPTFEVGFFLTNSGTRPAALGNASIKPSSVTEWTDVVLYPGVDGEDSLVVKSGEARMLKAHLFHMPESVFGKSFDFRVEVMNFSSGRKPVIVSGKPKSGGWTAFD